MSTGWREFEKLIARIERILAPVGAVVKSPDSIEDKVTGEMREIDASIRYEVGSTPILITIECRDRAKIEDVMWIEQLVTKSRDIGASATVAVSSTGFSKPAIRKAQFYNIGIRTTEQVTFQDVTAWLRAESITIRTNNWDLEDLALELYDAPNSVELDGKLQQLFRQDKNQALIFTRKSDQKGFSVESILIEWQKRNGNLFADVPTDGAVVHKHLHQPLERNGLQVLTNSGPFEVKCIHMRLALQSRVEVLPISRLIQYANTDKPLLQSAEWDLSYGVVLSLHRNMETGEIHVRRNQ